MSEAKGGRRANAGPTDPDLVNETERRRLEDAFWEIYNKNVIDRKVLCDHIYGILLALMQNPYLRQRPDVRFFVDQEGKVCFIDSRSNETNRARRLVPVKTNAEFEGLKQRLQTNRENLKRREQQLMAELNDYNLAEKEILPDVRNLRNGSLVKKSLLRAFNDSYTYLRRSLEELQRSLENQEQVVRRAKLAKEVGDWLLEQIEQENST